MCEPAVTIVIYITSVILMSSDLASKVNEKSDNLVTFLTKCLVICMQSIFKVNRVYAKLKPSLYYNTQLLSTISVSLSLFHCFKRTVIKL